MLDLPDLVEGHDRWQYSYLVTGREFAAGQGFSIHFDVTRYAALENPSIPDAAWDVIVLQPDPLIPDDGLYDAQALASTNPANLIFHVTFVHLAASPPGSQPFSIYGSDFSDLETGRTVPEPSAILFVLAGLLVLSRMGYPHRSMLTEVTFGRPANTIHKCQ